MKRTILVTLFCVFCSISISAQGTEFSYQGSLKDGANPANGNYDFEFALYDASSGGIQLAVNAFNNLSVTNGTFSVKLDFGSPAFPGANRFLEIRVKLAGQPGFSTLTPRQQVNSAPYSVKSINATTATTATNATQLGGVAANQYVVTSDPRLSDARNPLPGSTNYIQNTTSPQSTSNFNISGSGVINGNLSVGSQTSLSPLTVFTGTGFGLTHTNGTASIGTYINSNGGWLGTASNHPLKFFTNNSFEQMTISTNGNVGIGTTNPVQKLQVSGITSLGDPGGVYGYMLSSGYGTLGFNNYYNGSGAYLAGSTGYGGVFQFSNGDGSLSYYNSATSFPGGSAMTLSPQFTIASTGNVGISTVPTSNRKLDVLATGGGIAVYGRSDSATGIAIYGSNSTTGYAGYFNGLVGINAFAGGSGSPLCLNSTPLNAIGFCSSSLRYKKDLQPFSDGLSLVNQLRPITYKWKSDDKLDVGFGAEDVGKINPLFVFYNQKGEIEGVKYDRLSVAFVNAFKEQQAQIEAQQKEIAMWKAAEQRLQSQIDMQQKQLEALKKLICPAGSDSTFCKE